MQPDSGAGIAIIGGGISGVTTAVLLQVMGYRSVLYAKEQPWYDIDPVCPPEFATPHAAASALPHSVSSPRIAHWTSISQAFFRALSFNACCGVRRQVHYEIFEDPVPVLPPYAAAVDNFVLLTPDQLKQPWVPRRQGAGPTYGWQFDAFFCEAPEYLRFLYLLYAELGGRVFGVAGDGSLAAYLERNHDAYVNCTGVGAYRLLASTCRDDRCADAPMAPDFEPLLDPLPAKLIRGHYLKVDIKEILADKRGQFFSYNYRPSAAIYCTESGRPMDVYCYPRTDAWILGGSRQEGRIDEDGNWVGERTVGEEIEFPRQNASALAIPAPVLRLNADLLLRVTGGQLDLARRVQCDPGAVMPGVGYRFVRDSKADSIRIGCSRVRFAGRHTYVIHNYGHGGSGFALSWGCAFDVLRLLRRAVEAPPSREHGRRRTRFVLHHAATRHLLADLVERLLTNEA